MKDAIVNVGCEFYSSIVCVSSNYVAVIGNIWQEDVPRSLQSNFVFSCKMGWSSFIWFIRYYQFYSDTIWPGWITPSILF